MTQSSFSPQMIETLPIICNSFPELPKPQIEREANLDTIDELFDTKKIVIVEGKEGVGKTTLLAQFSLRHPRTAISLFIRPLSRFTYDLDVLAWDIANQIEWLLKGKQLDPLTEVSDSLLRKYIFALGRFSHQRREKYYFVIDGLYDIPAQDSVTQEQIIDLLPLATRNIKILLSSRSDDLISRNAFGDLPKTFVLGGFSLEETKSYFSDYSIDNYTIKELHKICSRNPSYLASIRRMLDSGRDIHELLIELPETLPEMFELEWTNVSDGNNEQLLLSVVAHDTRRHSIQALSQLLDLDQAIVTELIQKHNFFTVETDGISYISEAMRRFAATKVSYTKAEVFDIIIRKITSNLDVLNKSEIANYLPNYLYEGNRLSELVSYLSDDYFEDALMASQSMAYIRKMATLGMETARQLHNDNALIRFSVFSSLIAELSIAETWRSEVEALMELDDYDGALSLAQSAKLQEDRLHLLAAIARRKSSQGEEPEPELLEQIKTLHLQVDYTGLSDERVQEIALDLIFSAPEIALEIVEKTQNGEEWHDSFDLTLTKLSIALMQGERNEIEANNASEKIRSRIKNPGLRKLSDEIASRYKDYSSEEILADTAKLDDITDKLYLLRNWTKSNRKNENAPEVIEYALQLTFQSTAFTPNATLFRELASPLPDISDLNKLKQLVGKFDSQKAFCEQFGPTEDYVRLQLILARSELKIDVTNTENRIVEIYYYINGLQELITKAECLSRLLATLYIINQPEIFEDKNGLCTITELDLKDCFENVLKFCADQLSASKGIIRALAKTRPELASNFALSLNTQSRRDRALSNFIDSLLDTSDTKLNLSAIQNAISKIVNIDSRDDALYRVFRRLSFVETKDATIFNAANPILATSKEMRDANQRCRALCYILRFHLSQEMALDSVLPFDLIKLLEEAFHAHDVMWAKVDVGFFISQSLTKYSKELGRQYLNLSQQIRSQIPICNETLANAYINSIRIAIRAFSGLLSNGLDKAEDFDYLRNLIARIPSSGFQAELWAEVALHFFLQKKSDNAKEIVNSHVRPLLENIAIDDSYFRDEITTVIAPALYLTNHNITMGLISQISSRHQNQAYVTICFFLLRKQLLSDPVDANATYKVIYEDALDICELLPKMTEDGAIHYFIEAICDSIERSSSVLNRNQKADILGRLETITDKYFPTVNGIQHEGYKIIALAQIYRAKRAKAIEWKNLTVRARALPNEADKAYLLSAIAKAMQSSSISEKLQLLSEAEKITATIPSIIDRAGHYEVLASSARQIDAAFTRKMLEIAMKTAISSDDPAIDNIRRRLIDLAYRIDSELATKLASQIDDDPARLRAKLVVKETMEALKLKNSLISGKDENSGKQNYAHACNMYLAALNAGRVDTLTLDAVNRLLMVVPELPLHDSYHILSLIAQNNVVRYGHAKHAERFIRPYFDVTLLSAQLVEGVATRVNRDIERDSRHIVHEPAVMGILVEPGQKQQALVFIENWLKSHAHDYLIICDGYFGLLDLDIVQRIGSINPELEITVLTSSKHQKDQNTSQPFSEAYRTYWNIQLSDAPPPNTKIIIVGLPNGNLPIHDRWLLTENSGLRLGTSFNGLGARAAEISVMDPQKTQEIEDELRQYISLSKRMHLGERITYESFTL